MSNLWITHALDKEAIYANVIPSGSFGRGELADDGLNCMPETTRLVKAGFSLTPLLA
jgi:hypothetical protein